MKRLLLVLLSALALPAHAACDIDQGVRVKFGGDGSAVWQTWWCPPAARWLDYTPDGGSLALAALGDPALLGKVSAGIVSGDTAKLRALASQGLAAGAKTQQIATRPAAPVVVAKNGTTPTRPTFALLGATGTRSPNAQKTIRAPVGARAACGVTMVAEGSNVYCAWEAPDRTVQRNILTLVAEVK